MKPGRYAVSAEANKLIIRQLVQDGWSTGSLETLSSLLAADFVDHAAEPGGPGGPEAFKQQVRTFRNAFPGGQTQIDDLIAEGDKVVLRWTDGGTHRGEYLGV